MTTLTCFKAYDVRGRIPTELNEDLVYKIGCSYAGFVKPRRVAVGRDIRATSQTLSAALIRGLNDSGVDVEDIGLCGTEGVYFATFSAELGTVRQKWMKFTSELFVKWRSWGFLELLSPRDLVFAGKPLMTS